MLAEQPHHSLATVRDGPHLRKVFFFRCAGCVLALLGFLPNGLQLFARDLNGLIQLGLFLFGSFGPLEELFRILP